MFTLSVCPDEASVRSAMLIRCTISWYLSQHYHAQPADNAMSDHTPSTVGVAVLARRASLPMLCALFVLVIPVVLLVSLMRGNNSTISLGSRSAVQGVITLSGPALPPQLVVQLPPDLQVVRASRNIRSTTSLVTFPELDSWSPSYSDWVPGVNRVSKVTYVHVPPGESVYVSTVTGVAVVPLQAAAREFPGLSIQGDRISPQVVKLTFTASAELSDNLLKWGPLTDQPWPMQVESCSTSAGAISARWDPNGGPTSGLGALQLSNAPGSLACEFSVAQGIGSDLRVSVFVRGSTGILGCLYYPEAKSCGAQLSSTQADAWHRVSSLVPATALLAYLYLYGPRSGRGIAEYSEASVNSLKVPPGPIVIVTKTCLSNGGGAGVPTFAAFLQESRRCGGSSASVQHG